MEFWSENRSNGSWTICLKQDPNGLACTVQGWNNRNKKLNVSGFLWLRLMTIITLTYFREYSFCRVEYTQLPFKTDVSFLLPMSHHQYLSTTWYAFHCRLHLRPPFWWVICPALNNMSTVLCFAWIDFIQPFLYYKFITRPPWLIQHTNA